MAVSYMTKDGYDKILAEINYLETVKRPEISAQIAEARDKGDLSENAEYDAAKEMQGHIDGRIAELEGKIPALQIIDPKTLQAGDRIAVCISGGKDSMLMAKLMQELQRHSEVPFELVYLVMDPGYNEINRQKIESNAALRKVFVTE